MFNKNHFYNLHKFNRKSLVALAVLAGLLIGGTTVNSMTANVSAHARTHRVLHIHRIRRHARRAHAIRRYRRHARSSRRRYRFSRKEFAALRHAGTKRTRRSSRTAKRNVIAKDGNNDFARETASDIYKEINRVRKQDGLKPLPIDVDIQKVANKRNRQVNYAYTHYNNYKNYAANRGTDPSDNWIHGYDLKETAGDDAARLGISDKMGTAENAGNIYVKGNTRYAGGHRIYNVTDPQNAACANIDNMTNDDSSSAWAHRINILDKSATGIGVASYYNPQTQYSTNVEDFSYGNNPQDI